jgi:hypothetical protein
MGYWCGCGYATNGTLEDLLGHVRGCHDVCVRLGHIHFAHCNEDGCLRTNGHGRRLSSFEALQNHLNDEHCVEIGEGEYY